MARPSGSLPPIAIDRALIERRALAYLDRYDASAAKLRSVILRGLRQRTKDPAELERAAALLDQLIARYQSNGILDDARYAALTARTLRARGTSSRLIRQKLMTRGIAQEVTEHVLSGLAADVPEDEAALQWARRRRIGPFRAADQRQALLRRDFAALARAGFDAGVIRRVLGASLGEDD